MRIATPTSREPSSGVRELVGLAALDELPLTRGLIVDRQHLDRLAGVRVERLAAAFLDDDLMAVLEPENDDGMLAVDVLFPKLFGSGRHGDWVKVARRYPVSGECGMRERERTTGRGLSALDFRHEPQHSIQSLY